MSHYIERLHQAIRNKKTPVVVGLDPRIDQLPKEIVDSAYRTYGKSAAGVAAAFEEYCFRLIDVVQALVPAVKPQAAFFEEWGPDGSAVLARVMRRARQAGLIVICDGKRGDIGSTAEAYARGYLAGSDPTAARWAADALTVNAYLGSDTLEPFVRIAVERGAAIYVVVRSTNPGAGTFQDPISDSLPLFRRMAAVVEKLAVETCRDTDYGAVGAVTAATNPEELAVLREVLSHAPLLVPGYGAQGASPRDVAAAIRPDGMGALISSSRAINFAYRQEPYASQFAPHEWEKAVEAATHQMIDDVANETAAKALRGGESR